MIGQSRIDGNTRRDRGRGIADTLLYRGLVVWASKALVNDFWVWASKLDGVRDGIGGGV